MEVSKPVSGECSVCCKGSWRYGEPIAKGTVVMEQYELRMTEKQKARFLEVVRERMQERHMATRQLAWETGYAESSVYQFLGNTKIQNRFLAAKIAFVLRIRRDEWK